MQRIDRLERDPARAHGRRRRTRELLGALAVCLLAAAASGGGAAGERPEIAGRPESAPVALTDSELAGLAGGSRTLICLASAAASGCDIGGAIGGFLDEHGCGGICGAGGCVVGAAAGFINGVFRGC